MEQRAKGASRLLSATSPCSQALWWYRVWSGPLAKLIYTSVMAAEILQQHMLPSRPHLFQGRPCIVQADHVKPHSAHVPKAWLRRRRRVLDWPAAVLTCPQQRMLENFDMKLSGICCMPEIMSVFNKLDEANETKHEVSLVHAVIRNVTMSVFLYFFN